MLDKAMTDSMLTDGSMNDPTNNPMHEALQGLSELPSLRADLLLCCRVLRACPRSFHGVRRPAKAVAARCPPQAA
jgi:hypothetical protein